MPLTPLSFDNISYKFIFGIPCWGLLANQTNDVIFSWTGTIVLRSVSMLSGLTLSIFVMILSITIFLHVSIILKRPWVLFVLCICNSICNDKMISYREAIKVKYQSSMLVFIKEYNYNNIIYLIFHVHKSNLISKYSIWQNIVTILY